MPGGIRNIGIPLTIAGMGVLTCTLLVSMASVVAAIAILVVGMGVILVLAIRDREHRNMVDRAVEKRTWMAAQRTGANRYRSGLLAPIDGGKAMLPGILSRVGLTSALDGLGGEFCLVRHAHTGEYSLLLSCQPQGASLADDDVEDSYVASWAGLMESLASETRRHPTGRDRGHGTRFRRAFPPHAEQTHRGGRSRARGARHGADHGPVRSRRRFQRRDAHLDFPLHRP